MQSGLSEVERLVRAHDPAISSVISDLIAHVPPALHSELNQELKRIQDEARARETKPPTPSPTPEPDAASPIPAGDSAPEPGAEPASEMPVEPVERDNLAELLDRDSPNLQLHPGAKDSDVAVFEKAEKRFWEAKEARGRNDPRANNLVDQAISLLKNAKSALLHDAAPSFYLGIASYWAHDLAAAKENLTHAADMNPKFHEAITWLAALDEIAGKQDNALTRLAKALELKPGFPPALFRRALYLAFQGKFKEAHADVVKLLEAHPNNVSAKQVSLVVDGPGWSEKFEKESEHYIVRTDVSQEFADEMSKQAELIHKLYASREVFRAPLPSGWTKKFPIVVFKDAAEYHQVTGMPSSVLGHYSLLLRQLFLFQRDDTDETLRVLYHEAFHQFLHPYLRDAPIWFNEGLAEYFGACEHVRSAKGVDGMKVRTQPGRVRDAQRYLAASKNQLPWRQFMMLPPSKFMASGAASYNYALSWSIVFFLCQYENGQYVDILLNYYKALRAGATPEAACDAALRGYDTKDIEKKWAAFVTALPRQ
jgi:tetratricopeptide (TPR) repeat protein